MLKSQINYLFCSVLSHPKYFKVTDMVADVMAADSAATNTASN